MKARCEIDLSPGRPEPAAERRGRAGRASGDASRPWDGESGHAGTRIEAQAACAASAARIIGPDPLSSGGGIALTGSLDLSNRGAPKTAP